jgi:energy-coupling factor transporter ATP-binding protein EcfA2
MDPLTITLIAVSVFGLGVGAAASWEKILTVLAGKKIAVIGARGAGKTTLLRYLNMLNMEALEMEQTRNAEKTRSSSIDLDISGKNKNILLKRTVDLPGSEEYRDNGKWKESVENSDIVLYLIHAGALLRGIDKSNERNKKRNSKEIKQETEKRIEDDLQNLQAWIKEIKDGKKRNIPTFIIGNHFDEVDENFINSNKIEDYEKEFSNNKVINRYSIGMIKIIGSLKTRDTMKDILERVVKTLEAR